MDRRNNSTGPTVRPVSDCRAENQAVFAAPDSDGDGEIGNFVDGDDATSEDDTVGHGDADDCLDTDAASPHTPEQGLDDASDDDEFVSRPDDGAKLAAQRVVMTEFDPTKPNSWLPGIAHGKPRTPRRVLVGPVAALEPGTPPPQPHSGRLEVQTGDGPSRSSAWL
jgi:hypothetical protein